MINSVRARGYGSGTRLPEKASVIRFRCETCQMGEAYRPCRPEVTWGSYLLNPHLMETGWVHRVRELQKFDIIDTRGGKHTLVPSRTPKGSSSSKGTTDTLFTVDGILLWRGRMFGRATILDALENAHDLNFRLDDQTHWFDESKTRIILQQHREVEVVDTEGKRYGIARPGSLAAHKAEAFQQWKHHLRRISLKLMGEDVTQRFQLNIDPQWSFYDSDYVLQPVGSQTQLDRFDWEYDADVSNDLEEHLSKIRNVQ